MKLLPNNLIIIGDYNQVHLAMSTQELAQNNYVKYEFYVWVLDMLAWNNGLNNKIEMDYDGLKDGFIKAKRNVFKIKDNFLVLWFSELQLMGYIEIYANAPSPSGKVVELTEAGYEAFKTQRFHSIAANLCEAIESKKLAKTAIRIAILVGIITMITSLIALIC